MPNPTLLLALLLSVIVIQATTKQIYMSEVHRHGARYPVYDYYDYN